MKRPKFDIGNEIRSIARERVGSVRPSHVIPPKPKHRKPKHKKQDVED